MSIDMIVSSIESSFAESHCFRNTKILFFVCLLLLYESMTPNLDFPSFSSPKRCPKLSLKHLKIGAHIFLSWDCSSRLAFFMVSLSCFVRTKHFVFEASGAFAAVFAAEAFLATVKKWREKKLEKTPEQLADNTLNTPETTLVIARNGLRKTSVSGSVVCSRAS